VYAVISPAKKLDFDPPTRRLELTAPELFKETRLLSETTSGLKASDLKRLMKLSDPLAKLNYRRFQEFDAKTSRPPGSKQAALAFDGDTYVGLRAGDLSAEQLAYAQNHLGILSGLYGILRPLDAILPYRLEMGTRLANPRGKSLYDFWGDRVAKKINARLKKIGSDILVNLASKEYFTVVDESALKARVVTPIFKEKRGKDLQIISFNAKRARGTMARFIIQNAIEREKDLESFAEDSYRFERKLSSENELVFVR
jgi:cytoplasmic iron level regulating protein YaaA (DUF328/UPF0246 family)